MIDHNIYWKWWFPTFIYVSFSEGTWLILEFPGAGQLILGWIWMAGFMDYPCSCPEKKGKYLQRIAGPPILKYREQDQVNNCRAFDGIWMVFGWHLAMKHHWSPWTTCSHLQAATSPGHPHRPGTFSQSQCSPAETRDMKPVPSPSWTIMVKYI